MLSATLTAALAVLLSFMDASSLSSEIRTDGASTIVEPRLTPSRDAIPAINPRTARYLTRRARLRAPNVERGDGFSDTAFFSTLGLNMTRAITAPDGDGVRDVALLMARLHAQQHPQSAAPYESRAVACSKARLLVVQFVPESELLPRPRILLAAPCNVRVPPLAGFEGLCSILKTLMLGLGQVCAGSLQHLVALRELHPPPRLRDFVCPLIRPRGRTGR